MQHEPINRLFPPEAPEARKAGLLGAIERGDTDVTNEMLLDTLEHETTNAIRERIQLVIASRLNPEDGDTVERMFSSSDAYVRNSAAEILASDPERFQSLSGRFFYHKDKDIRKFALDVFRGLENDEILGMIAERTSDTDANVRIAAIENLANHPKGSRFVCSVENALLQAESVLLTCAALRFLSIHAVSPSYEEILSRFDGERVLGVLGPLTEYLASVGDERAIDFILRQYGEGRYCDWITPMHAVRSIARRIESTVACHRIGVQLRFFLENTGDQLVRWYLGTVLEKCEGEVTANDNALASEETGGDTLRSLIAIVERIGVIGNDMDIPLLERIGGAVDADSVLESVRRAIEQIARRTQRPEQLWS